MSRTFLELMALRANPNESWQYGIWHFDLTKEDLETLFTGPSLFELAEAYQKFWTRDRHVL